MKSSKNNIFKYYEDLCTELVSLVLPYKISLLKILSRNYFLNFILFYVDKLSSFFDLLLL